MYCISHSQALVNLCAKLMGEMQELVYLRIQGGVHFRLQNLVFRVRDDGVGHRTESTEEMTPNAKAKPKKPKQNVE